MSDIGTSVSLTSAGPNASGLDASEDEGSTCDPDEPASRPRHRPNGSNRSCVNLQMHASEPQPPLSRWFVATLRRLIQRADLDYGLVTVAVIEGAMADLHGRYCGASGNTDVLTCDLRGPDLTSPSDPHPPIKANIVICIDEVIRKTHRSCGHNVCLGILLHVAHGPLHLMGYDDHIATKAAKMHDREEKLLAQTGLPSVVRTVRNQQPGSTLDSTSNRLLDVVTSRRPPRRRRLSDRQESTTFRGR